MVNNFCLNWHMTSLLDLSLYLYYVKFMEIWSFKLNLLSGKQHYAVFKRGGGGAYLETDAIPIPNYVCVLLLVMYSIPFKEIR